jgi:hypothetical protein
MARLGVVRQGLTYKEFMRIKAKIAIEGTKSILFHTFPIDTLTPGKSRGGTTGKDEEEWKSTVLMTGNRQLYVMGTYLIGAIKSAGKLIKVGKGNMMKKIESCLECLEDVVLLDNLFVPEDSQLTKSSMDPVYIDVRSVVNPSTKGRNLRFRIAAKAGWKLSAAIEWDDSLVSKETMKECVTNAGLYEGIGDGRRIGFGRFSVVSFEIRK